MAVAGCAVALVACVPTAPEVGDLPMASPRVLADSLERAARQASVRVRSRTCDGLERGSGVVVGPREVVTNRHVVDGAERWQVNTWDGRSRVVEWVRVAESTDLAVLRVDGPLPPPVELGSDPAAGDEILVVGFPGGEPVSLSRGLVLGVDRDPGYTESGPVIRVDAHIAPGGSGGALLDRHGRLVGVMFARDTRDLAGLAIPVSRLRDAVEGEDLGRVEGCGAA